jgi:hypothetical protein
VIIVYFFAPESVGIFGIPFLVIGFFARFTARVEAVFPYVFAREVVFVQLFYLLAF